MSSYSKQFEAKYEDDDAIYKNVLGCKDKKDIQHILKTLRTSSPEKVSDQQIKINFAKKFSQQLNSTNQTIRKFSSLTGIPESTLSDYRLGKGVPTIINLVHIAKGLEISSDYLLDLSKASSTNPDMQYISKYTGLTTDALNILHENCSNNEHPLYSYIFSYLIESGNLDHIISILEKSLISQEQFSALYQEDEQSQTEMLDNLEYQFTKASIPLFNDTINSLKTKLSLELKLIVSESWEDVIEHAYVTRENMDLIIRNAEKENLASLETLGLSGEDINFYESKKKE